MSSVAIQDWRVTVSDLTRVVQDNNLSSEGLGTSSGVVLGVRGDVTSSDILNRDVLHVEANVVAGESLRERLVVHFNGLDFSGELGWSKSGDDTWSDDTSFDSADRYSSNTTDLVDILKRKTKRLVRGSGWGNDGVKSFDHGLSGELSFLDFLVPALVPAHVAGGLDHVVTVPSGDGDESNRLGVVADLLDVGRDFGGDFVESGLGVWWFGGVHFVNTDDHLLDTKGESKESVFSSLAILGDTGFELTDTSSDDKNGAISLGSTSNHVFDEISVSGSVDDGDVEFSSFELPESDIDGDTSFSFGLKLVQNPGVLERAFAHFGGFFLELLDGSLVNTTALVDQVTGGCRFTRIDVADNDDVNVSLFFSHVFNLYLDSEKLT